MCDIYKIQIATKSVLGSGIISEGRLYISILRLVRSSVDKYKISLFFLSQGRFKNFDKTTWSLMKWLTSAPLSGTSSKLHTNKLISSST